MHMGLRESVEDPHYSLHDLLDHFITFNTYRSLQTLEGIECVEIDFQALLGGTISVSPRIQTVS